MNKKLINEIDRIHELLFQKQQLNEVIGQLSNAAVRAAIKNTIKNVIKTTFKNNIDTILKKSPKYLSSVMSVDDLFKKSKDEIINALKKADPKIDKMNPELLNMSVRTHFKELVAAESEAITKELVDDLAKTAVKSAPPIKIPKPGDVLTSSSFVDDAIDWSKVTNAKNMKEYNQVIIDALKRNDFSKISRGGFEQYGIPNFREFLEKGINKEKKLMFDPNKGTWFFQLNKELPGKIPGQMNVSKALEKIGIDNSGDYARILSKDEIIPKSKLDIIFKNADEVKKVVKKVDPEDLPFVEVVSKELADPDKVKKLKSGWMGNFNFNNKKAQLMNNLKSWGILNSAGKMTNVGWGALTVMGLGTVAMYGALQETGVDMTEVSPEILPNTETDHSDYQKLAQERIAYWDSQKGGGQYGGGMDTGFGRVLPAQQARIKELLSKAGISGEELNQTTINQLYKFLQG